MYKIGLSSGGFLLTEENFKKLSESGIESVEISMDLENHFLIKHKEVSNYSKKYGVELWSYHLPFDFETIDVSSIKKEQRDHSINLYTELIAKATDIGINKFVIHPSSEPIADDIREECIKYSMQSLDALAEIAYRYGAVIAVEDLPRSCIGNTADEMLRLVSANDKLRVCFDTNHLLYDNIFNFMDKLGDKIVTLHVSDYDYIDEKHWLPGEGKIDWRKMISKLHEIDYRGVWMYELGLKNTPKITRNRDLTFVDFVKNAKAIFAEKTPERIF